MNNDLKIFKYIVKTETVDHNGVEFELAKIRAYKDSGFITLSPVDTKRLLNGFKDIDNMIVESDLKLQMKNILIDQHYNRSL